ncbi:MAG: thiol-disulfide oxidoreductase DCC family protein [Paracoccaceae bacterium]|tara:strand:+ start:443 stop:820 length:378 start_codon:yes stop_codon:yes gene_type:complete
MKPRVRVLYNASCPICNFEIKHYQKYVDKANLAIDFDDLNGANIANWSISPDKAARRLYVSRGDQTVSGIDAFIILWSEMPRYRWLFHFIRQPVIKQFSGLIYDNLLAPFIYYLHLKRQKIKKKE